MELSDTHLIMLRILKDTYKNEGQLWGRGDDFLLDLGKPAVSLQMTSFLQGFGLFSLSCLISAASCGFSVLKRISYF